MFVYYRTSGKVAESKLISEMSTNPSLVQTDLSVPSIFQVNKDSQGKTSISIDIRENSYFDNIKELGLEEQYNIVFKIPKLNSDSMFVEMDKETDNAILDEKYLENQKEKMVCEYRELFDKNDKLINRAIMSAVLSELPIFFNNISELQDYIYNTLSICTDKAEKLACIEIINGIMAE